jgi:membrane protein YqaA with SNARE-associated domain
MTHRKEVLAAAIMVFLMGGMVGYVLGRVIPHYSERSK